MVSLTLSVSKDLRDRMKKHPEILWSDVVRSVIERQLDELETADAIARKSKLTVEDVLEFSKKVDEGMAKRVKAIINASSG